MHHIRHKIKSSGKDKAIFSSANFEEIQAKWVELCAELPTPQESSTFFRSFSDDIYYIS